MSTASAMAGLTVVGGTLSPDVPPQTSSFPFSQLTPARAYTRAYVLLWLSVCACVGPMACGVWARMCAGVHVGVRGVCVGARCCMRGSVGVRSCFPARGARCPPLRDRLRDMLPSYG